MAHIEQEGNLWVVYDDVGGFTEFAYEEDAIQFLDMLGG